MHMGEHSTKATVFIVDDDKDSRESVQALVSTMDVHTALFASGEAFLEAYDPSQPGCLITDLRMQGMSGEELHAEVNRRGFRIPTIIMSGYADKPASDWTIECWTSN